MAESTTPRIFLRDFVSLTPRHRSSQEHGYEWLSRAFSRVNPSIPQEKARRLLERCGCDPGRVAWRWHELEDFTHFRWDEMEIFRLDEAPQGLDVRERTAFFVRSLKSHFERLYPDEGEAVDDLIHVTCTGYAMPSNAQRLVASRGWSRKTTVTHLYHMGCLAAFPAIRVGTGFLAHSATSEIVPSGERRKKRVDVVHTELCTLHLNPSRQEPRDIVAQSLFADGIIRYSLGTEAGPGGLELIRVLDRILPDSAEAMTWMPEPWGMAMQLDRAIPGLIAAALPSFVEALGGPVGLDLRELRARALFAVHPGGPRIVDQIGEALELSPGQLRHSRETLRDRGNMSSATLPHVWMRMLEDPQVEPGQLIASFGFGPGLTICGSLMRKH